MSAADLMAVLLASHLPYDFEQSDNTWNDEMAEGSIWEALGHAAHYGLDNAGHPPRVVRLAVRRMPGSGKPAEPLRAAGIDAAAIPTLRDDWRARETSHRVEASRLAARNGTRLRSMPPRHPQYTDALAARSREATEPADQALSSEP